VERAARWSGAQEFGADDGLDLADLAGEEGVPDAGLARCALEAGLPGIARRFRMRCSAPGWVKAFQMSGLNAPGPPKAREDGRGR
jgi:hypothetical protein